VTGIEAADARGWPFAVRSRLVVGADGRASVVARVLGLVRPRRPERLALIQDVQGLDGFDQMSEIYIDPPDYSVLSPVTPGLVNLSLMVPLAHARPFRNRLEMFFHARLKQLRHLMPRLRGMRPQGRPVAMGPLAYRVMAPRHGGVLLSGDAAGVYDPFMSEGLHAALHSAELLVEVATAPSPAAMCPRALSAPMRTRAALPPATRNGSPAPFGSSSRGAPSPTASRAPSPAARRCSTPSWGDRRLHPAAGAAALVHPAPAPLSSAREPASGGLLAQAGRGAGAVSSRSRGSSPARPAP